MAISLIALMRFNDTVADNSEESCSDLQLYSIMPKFMAIHSQSITLSSCNE